MNIAFVDIKNEYTYHLTKILTPVIFEGIQSIYNTAKECIENESLKIFQKYLGAIPEWNTNMIETEVTRIKSNSKPYLYDLVRATLKAHIIVLSFNPYQVDQKINHDLYKNLELGTFIHKVYIECAREFWNNPYLLYHKYSAIDIKRNQRDSLNIIKDCIKDAIRKMLPIEDIMKVFLAGEKEITENLRQFTDESNTKESKQQVINKYESSTSVTNIKDKSESDKNINKSESDKNINKSESNNDTNKSESNNDTKSEKVDDLKSMKGGRDSSNTSESSIKDLIEKIEMKLNSNQSTKEVPSTTEVVNVKHSNNLDTKLENMLGDTDIDTSINYSIENNLNNYQEIYGND